MDHFWRAVEELLEFLPEAALLIEDRRRIVAANRQAAELVGCPPARLRDAPIESLLTIEGPPNGSAARSTAFPESPDGRAGKPFECVLERADGRRLPVEIGHRTIAREGRRLVVAIVHDITERKRAEDELRGSEERLRQAVRVSEIGIFDHDHATDTHYFSPRQREMYGWPDHRVINVPNFLAVLHPDDRDPIAAAIRRAHDPAGDGKFDVEHRIIRSDGEVRWIATRSITLFEGEGAERHPVRTVGASIDFTERKLAEENRERLTAMLDATPDFVGLTDASARTLYMNRAARELSGLGPREDVSSSRLEDRHPPWAVKLLRETAIPHAVRDGAWRGETALLGKDGAEIPFSQIVLSHRSGGEVTFFSTIARDVSHEKKLEAQLLQAQKMEAIGRLAGGVAHDFNNLLSVILNASTFAQRLLPKDDPVQAELEDVRIAGERAAELTRRMLAFSRKQALRPQVIDVNEVLRGLAPMLRRLLREHIEQALVLAADCARIKADPGHLEQVIMNLVVNACDAMPSGGKLTIETRNAGIDECPPGSHLEAHAGSVVTIVVSDTGVGMDAATKARIFEPFFTTKEPGQGTGLGLAMVFGFVKQSGGEIVVSSVSGRGTTFTLYFPGTMESVAAKPQAPQAPRSTAGAETVLLVEDEGQVRKLVANVLRRAGYRVLAAGRPSEALRQSREWTGAIDLLVTDMVMPEMSGKDLADRLTTERPALRVLYMSGYTEQAVALLPGARHFMPKPFSFDDLLGTVREILDGPGRDG